MKKWFSILFASAVLLSGCNVQTVSEYDKEMARLQAQDQDEDIVDVSEQKESKPAEVETTAEKKETAKEKAHEKEKSSPPANQQQTIVAEQKKPSERESKSVEQTTTTTKSSPTTSAEQKVSTQPKQTTKDETTSAPKKEETQQHKAVAEKKEVEKKVQAQSKAPQKEKQEAQRPAATTTAPTKTPVTHEAKKEVVTVSVRVDTLLKPEHYKRLPEALQQRKYVPANGVIIEASTYTIEKGDTAWTATRKALQKNDVHFEYEGEGETGYGSIYVEGINHIYEKQAGSLSGWMYAVNGKAPGVGASSYEVKDGDHITWHYTTNLGRDIGLAD
jgi:chemotaxis protein histidine kinase CheA